MHIKIQICGPLLVPVFSHEKKNSYFPLHWLFNKDPYKVLS